MSTNITSTIAELAKLAPQSVWMDLFELYSKCSGPAMATYKEARAACFSSTQPVDEEALTFYSAKTFASWITDLHEFILSGEATFFIEDNGMIDVGLHGEYYGDEFIQKNKGTVALDMVNKAIDKLKGQITQAATIKKHADHLKAIEAAHRKEMEAAQEKRTKAIHDITAHILNI